MEFEHQETKIPAIKAPELEPKAVLKPARIKTSLPDTSGFFCYIGPNLKGLIQTGSIYRGDRASALEAVAAAMETEPLIKVLLVSDDALPKARLQVKKPGNALYETYQTVLKNAREREAK